MKNVDKHLQLPHQITQYMDCESALKSLEKEFYKLGHTMDIDMDLVMSHKQLKENSNTLSQKKWVVGHAREKNKDCPKTVTEPEEDNSQCNVNTEDCVVNSEPPNHFLPFLGYRAMLRLH